MDLHHHLVVQEGTSFLKSFFFLNSYWQLFCRSLPPILLFCYLCVSTVSHLMNHGRTSASHTLMQAVICLKFCFSCFAFQILPVQITMTSTCQTQGIDSIEGNHEWGVHLASMSIITSIYTCRQCALQQNRLDSNHYGPQHQIVISNHKIRTSAVKCES